MITGDRQFTLGDLNILLASLLCCEKLKNLMREIYLIIAMRINEKGNNQSLF